MLQPTSPLQATRIRIKTHTSLSIVSPSNRKYSLVVIELESLLKSKARVRVLKVCSGWVGSENTDA